MTNQRQRLSDVKLLHSKNQIFVVPWVAGVPEKPPGGGSSPGFILSELKEYPGIFGSHVFAPSEQSEQIVQYHGFCNTIKRQCSNGYQ
jgi:hypothetical protein